MVQVSVRDVIYSAHHGSRAMKARAPIRTRLPGAEEVNKGVHSQGCSFRLRARPPETERQCNFP